MSAIVALEKRFPRNARIANVARRPISTLEYPDPSSDNSRNSSDYNRSYGALDDEFDASQPSRHDVLLRYKTIVGRRDSKSLFAGVAEVFSWVQGRTQRSEIRWPLNRTPLQVRNKVRTESTAYQASEEDVTESVTRRTADTASIDAAKSEQDWKFSSEGILQRLEDSNTRWEDRLIAVLFAETMAFDDKQRPRLLRRLYLFCENHRFSTDEETITVLGAAIRKYAMNMSEDDFERYAELLVPSETETLHHDVELELVKAVGWRLAYEPFDLGEGCPYLLKVLVELCRGYLTQRLILQRNYSSTALNGIIAVVSLESATGDFTSSHSLVERARELNMPWFYELLSDYLTEAIADLQVHRPDWSERLQDQVAFTA